MEQVVSVPTPIGRYHALIGGNGVRALSFPQCPKPKVTDNAPPTPETERLLADLAEWLKRELFAYHEGKLQRFTVPLDLSGHTAFRMRAWQAMGTIPYGKTISYGELAKQVKCGAPRAIGQACGANPMPVLVPCHRVVATGGRPGGWGGPPGMKERLLQLEKEFA